MWAVYLTSWTPSFATFLDVKDINVAELMGVNANFSYLAAILAIFIPLTLLREQYYSCYILPLRNQLRRI